jgi:uncharacterized membrane protein YhaH (DUF805 family)
MGIMKLFTSCEGRIDRSTFLLGTMIVSVPHFLIWSALTPVIMATLNSSPPIASFIWTFVCPSLWTILIWPLSAKRAHDINKNGWWLLIWTCALLLAPVTSLFSVALIFVNPTISFPLILLTSLCSLVGMYQFARLYLASGDPGANNFGAPSGGPSVEFNVGNDKSSSLVEQFTVKRPMRRATIGPTAFGRRGA